MSTGFWSTIGWIVYLVIGVYVARRRYVDQVVRNLQEHGTTTSSTDSDAFDFAAMVCFWPWFLLTHLFMTWFTKPANQEIRKVKARRASIEYWQRQADDNDLPPDERDAARQIVAFMNEPT